MKITKHICDRCGKEFKSRDWTGILKFSFIYRGYNRHFDVKQRYEVCEECRFSFTDWIKNSLKTEELKKGYPS